MMRFLTVNAALAGIVVALPSAPNFVVHERRDASPTLWNRQERADKNLLLPLRIGLKQSNLDRLNALVHEVSNPESSNFGKHWTAEQIANAFAPTSKTADETWQWLISSGIDPSRIQWSAGRNWLEVNSTVGEAEKLLNAQYYRYEHKDAKVARIASDQYSVPSHVQQHIDFVMPTIQLDTVGPVSRAKPAVSTAVEGVIGLSGGTGNCSHIITIDCIRELYKLPIPTSAQPGNELGIPEWADYLYNPDLDVFFANFTNPVIPKGTRAEFISIDGGKPGTYDRVQQQNNIESALDFMIAYSIIYPQNTRLYQVGDGVNVDSVGTFNIFLDALDASYCSYKGGNAPYIDPAYPDMNDGGFRGKLQCGGAKMSNVISISYGQIEAALPRFYQERQCHEWGKLALQGVSVIVASGDSGVANSYNSGYPNTCVDAQERYLDPHGKRFSPSFPNNCPFVTNVGATTLLTKNIADGERAVLSYGSGGGFSDIFTTPSWQAEAVGNYLKNYAPKYGPDVFNSSGRAFPDVAALGDNMAIVSGGHVSRSGGTSASAPLFASVITLLNDERLAAGKKPIGFLNPILYKNPGMFNDVTVGNNPGCGTSGFPASKGWDPVTGLGTPNYEKMRAVFNGLP
ncbi:hypothetical protein VHEMI08503 [[Torrubiella] hemipterigena]|uniref:tripeptidyl-peptidase II n=1 Tax=[Torrubiella] hemipterigena TaxID=1531966 RepID=A0A0A1TNA2_9HYPO|nr:hypothetical protein VHEMI08503 [[Torrubiella] hemipterigena]